MTLFKNIFQSSAFLSYNAFYFVWAFCTFSKINFPLNYYTFGYLSSWIASFLAIFVERENRRSLLATYVSNVVSHFLFHFLKSKVECRSTTLRFSFNFFFLRNDFFFFLNFSMRRMMTSNQTSTCHYTLLEAVFLISIT